MRPTTRPRPDHTSTHGPSAHDLEPGPTSWDEMRRELALREVRAKVVAARAEIDRLRHALRGAAHNAELEALDGHLARAERFTRMRMVA